MDSLLGWSIKTSDGLRRLADDMEKIRADMLLELSESRDESTSKDDRKTTDTTRVQSTIVSKTDDGPTRRKSIRNLSFSSLEKEDKLKPVEELKKESERLPEVNFVLKMLSQIFGD